MATEDNLTLGYYLVYFSDVLGQRERLRELRRLPTTDAERAEVLRALQDTVGFVTTLRQGYQDWFDAESNVSDIVEALPEPKRTAVLQARVTEVSLRAFSDSTVVSVCLVDEGDESCKAMTGVLAALLAACHMHLLCMSMGRPIRGGVDVGLGTPLADGEVYGPALERAYLLENECAKWPRIVVGQEFQGYLAAVCSQSPGSFQRNVARALAQKCQHLLCEDSDGQIVLDFLGEEVEASQAEPIVDQLVPDAYRFVERELARFRWAGDGKHADRYQRLWQYFVSRAHVWGIDASGSE
ncbi:MAG: hypothetical protein ACYC5O_11135 [Anaerolineae bacterium]